MKKLTLDFYYGQEAEQFTFYRLPKALITDNRFKDISNNSKLLYGLMLDRMSLSAKTGWFDDKNRVYIKYSLKNIRDDLNCSKTTAVGLLKELQTIGLIEIEQKNGLANIIYVKNFVSEEKTAPLNRSKNCTGTETDPANEKIRISEPITESEPVNINDRSKNKTGTGTKNIQVPVQKLTPNKTKDNKTKDNNINPINQSRNNSHAISLKTIDSIDRTEEYMELIRENISYDIVMDNYCHPDREMYDELFRLICDVVCVPRKNIRIGGEEYPYALVKNRFLNLNSTHLEYVIESLNNTTTKISNIRAYLITALYNAPDTMKNYYAAEVNYGMYGEGL